MVGIFRVPHTDSHVPETLLLQEWHSTRTAAGGFRRLAFFPASEFVVTQFFYNGGQTAINSLFLVYCCTYVGVEESLATPAYRN